MKYPFPHIHTIDDVIPHIKHRDEFIVAERPGYTVINYMVALKDTFNMAGPDDLGGAIRRECRGIMFGPQGNIISRPLHKFFNLLEREETFVENLNLNDLSHVEDKMDGSMVRPVIINGDIRWCTKMGITDGFSDRIEEFVNRDPNLVEIARNFLSIQCTPIFEWYGPQNRIVVGYQEEGMNLLACRHMISGVYVPGQLDGYSVGRQGSPESMDEFVNETRKQKGIEGYIFVFNDGHRVKLKTEEYVRIHKTKDELRYDFYIAQHILNEELDDVKPFLDEYDRKRVDEYENKFWEAFAYHESRLYILYEKCKGFDRKAVATQMLKDQDGWTKSLVFKLLDGKNIREVLLDHFKKNVNGQTDHKKLMEWV